MKSIKILVTLLFLGPGILFAGINLDWEYEFDAGSIGNPGHDYRIQSVLVAPSGYIALDLINSFSDLPRGRRVVLLNPDGSQSWISGNLHPDVADEKLTFTHVSKGALSFHIEQFDASRFYMYHSASGAALASIELTTENLVMKVSDAGSGSLKPPGSLFSSTSFYTYGDDDIEGPKTLKRYSLNVTTNLTVVVQSTTGISGTNLLMTWASVLNTLYQIQESSDLSTWVDVGQVISGTGSAMSWSTPIISGSKYYRIVQR